MTNKISFGSLWVGNPMSMVQKISLSSFVKHGHDLTLYVYDMKMPVPIGIKKADANKILPESELFVVKNSYGPFADIFRYSMIQKTGKAWVDADTICLRPDWNFKDNIFASYEIYLGKQTVVNGVLSLKQDSEIVDYLVKESMSFDKKKITWSEIGPQLVNKAFLKFNYMEYAYPPEVFLGIRGRGPEILWDPKYVSMIKQLIKNGCYSISVYNQEATIKGYDKNNFDKKSAMSHFLNIYYKGDYV